MATFTSLVGYLIVFTVLGIVFLFSTLLIGKLVRPNIPNSEKQAIYECGEPTIGSSWIQFDLRFYVVALLFVIFDVEVAFFFPWAAVFGKTTRIADPSATYDEIRQPLAELGIQPLAQSGTSPTPAELQKTQDAAATLGWIAFVDLLVFFGVVLVGFAYLWKRGDLDWVRSTATEPEAEPESSPQSAAQPVEITISEEAAV